VLCGRSSALEQKAADQPDGTESEIVDNLRAALDVERSTTQQLTESLLQEQGRVAELTAELSRLNEHFTEERAVAAQLRSNMDSVVVSRLRQVFYFIAHS